MPFVRAGLIDDLVAGWQDRGEPAALVPVLNGRRGNPVVLSRTLQAAIEERKLAVLSSEAEYIPQNVTTLPEDQATEVLELVDALEQDDDVQHVFHNLG